MLYLVLGVEVDLLEDPVGHDSSAPVQQQRETLGATLLYRVRDPIGSDRQTVERRLIPDVLLVRITSQLIEEDAAAGGSV